jgi:sulfhydrogenase subunit beta (sulfur reductase)
MLHSTTGRWNGLGNIICYNKKVLIIEKKNIDLLKKELEKNNPVFDARGGVLPAKQFFLPGREIIFTYDGKKIAAARKKGNCILFGLDLRDSEALAQLDEIMKQPKPDFFYVQKRKAATIVSIIDEEGAPPRAGIDLVLEKLNVKDYKATAITKKGQKIAKSKLFKERKTKKAAQSARQKRTVMPQLREMLLEPELLKDAVEWSWKNYPQIWEKLGQQCLGCGICTYVCPLCYCFSIEDQCAPNGSGCTRCRYWTACTLPEFSQISGGHKFHKTIKERYYNWFHHKFVRAYLEYGKSQCTACGRCKKYCPARIDIEKVLIQIYKSYANGLKSKYWHHL